MATNLQQTLTAPGYRNWVKAGLSLKCAKNGIQKFVGDRVQTLQQNELDDICQKNGLSPGTVCNGCTTHNVLPCPTRGICKPRGCNYHDNSNPSKQIKPCPNGICDEVRFRILKSHRFHGPSWRNTDALLWCSNSWEWGKCYLPPDGYNQVTSALETDFTGLLSIIINHKGFETMLAENLRSKNNVFCQARDIRNVILHTSTFQLSDADLNMYIDILIKMLSDQKLAADKDAQDAIAKLNQIKNGSLAVTTEDATQMREDALCAIREKGKEIIEHLEEKNQEAVKEIDKRQQEVIEDINTVGSQHIDHIVKAKEESIKDIATEGSQQVKNIDEKKEVVIKDIATEGSQQIKHIDEKKEEVIKDIATEGSQQIKHIDEKKEVVIKEIVTEGSQEVKNIDEKKEEVIKDIATEGSQQVKNIGEKKEEVIKDIATEGRQQVKNIGEKKQKVIKDIATEGSQQVKHIEEKKEVVIKEIVTEGSQQVKNIGEKKEEVIKDIATEGRQQVKNIGEKNEEVIKDIATEGSQQVKHIEEKKEVVINEITTEGSEQVLHIEEKKEVVIKEIVTKGSQQVKNIDEKKEGVIKDIMTNGSQQVECMEEKKDEMIEEMKKEVNYQTEHAEERKKAEYIKRKQNIQNDLIQQYLDYKLKIPIDPLIQDEETDITELYVAPLIIQVDPKHSRTGKEQETKIESYKDIFYKNSKQCKKIYITGKAGIGKTTLCQKMIFTWCNAHSKHMLPADQISEEVPQLSEDEKAMLEFSFLFHISLRHAGSDSNIDDMIKHQVLHDPDYQEMLPTLLHKEKCLIVLDGLDEWTKPECSHQMTSDMNKGLPDRQIMSKCTILTTTRPWKLEVLRLKTSEIDQQIELMGLDDKSSHSFVESLVTVLNTNQRSHKSAKDFEEELNKRNMKQFRAIPVILKQLVCLWHDGEPLGETQCTIYSGMVNLLFQLAEGRLADNQEFEKLKKEWTETQIELPKCFEDRMTCQEFRPLLRSLGRLSFKTLFSQYQEESLIFEHSTADMYGLSKTEIDLCLKIGILSQSKVMRGCTTRIKNLSFLHKTFQEYLAALYISTEPLVKIKAEIHSICNSISKVLEMSQVFVFISGMNPETASKLSKCISDVVSEDSDTQEYRQSSKKCSIILMSVQNMMLACVKESSDSGYIDTRFQLQDFFIQGTSQYLENLLCTNTNNIKSVYIHISLPIELQKILLQVETLHKLVIDSCCKVSVYLIYNLVIKSKKSLQCLYLSCFDDDLSDGYFLNDLESGYLVYASLLNDHASGYIFPLRRLGQVTDMSKLPVTFFPYMLHIPTNMKDLCLTHIKMSPYQLECLMSFLSNAKQMRIIHLSGIVLSDNHFHSYKLDLSHLQHLQWLGLTDLFVKKVNTSVLQFVKEVKVNTSVLQGFNISMQYPGVMSSVLERIQHAPQMQVLAIGSVAHQYPYDAIDALISTLPTLVYLKVIDLHNIDFGERELKLSSAMKNLETIFLCIVTMTRMSFCGFVDSIPDTRHSLHVDIVACSIKPSKETVNALNHIKSNQRFLVTSCSCKNEAFETYFYTVVAKEELEERTTVYRRSSDHAIERSSINILYNFSDMLNTNIH